MLEQKAYRGDLTELINASHFASDYKAIKDALTDVSDTMILMEIAKACGIKRIEVVQVAPQTRTRKAKTELGQKATVTKRRTAAKS